MVRAGEILSLAVIAVVIVMAIATIPQTLLALSVHMSNNTDHSSGGRLIVGFEQWPYPQGQQYQPSIPIPRLEHTGEGVEK